MPETRTPKSKTPENHKELNLRAFWSQAYESALQSGDDQHIARLKANKVVQDYKKANNNG